MLIRAKAPLRISFAGGGTDVSPFAEQEGGAVLNTTIDKHAFATLEPRDDDIYHIVDLDGDAEARGGIGDGFRCEPPHDLAGAMIRRLSVRRGFNLWLHADAPWGTGLGSSSTHIVAVLGAFEHWLRLGLSEYELAELAYEVERKDMGQKGGRQDQYSAAFGGFSFMEFSASGTLVTPLRVKPGILNELHFRMVLCSLGRTRHSPQILDDQIKRYAEKQADSVAAMLRTKQLASEMKRALLTGHIECMAALLDEAWRQKRRFSSLVSDGHIDAVIEDARGHGALAGKILGAGGGGHVLFICTYEGKARLIKHLREVGLEPVSFAFEPDGLTTWEVANGGS